MKNKFALITGASSGIGKAMSMLLAKQNYNVILVGRNEANLKQTQTEIIAAHNVEAIIFAADLADAAQTQALIDFTINGKFQLEILINNAGYGLWGTFEELSCAAQLEMMQVNMNSVIMLTHQLLPILKNQTQAYILNTSSATAFQPVPYLSVYAASKSFVDSFTKGLQLELKKQAPQVSVTSLLPGSTNTGFITRGGFNERIQKIADKVNMTPEAVAEIGLKAMFAKRAEIIPGASNWFGAKAVGFLPAALINKITTGIYQK